MEIFNAPVPQFLAAVLVFTGVWYVSKRRSSTSRLPPGTRVPPCLMSVPVLGSLPFMSVDPNNLHRYFMEQSAKYGNVFALHLGSRYTVVLNGYTSIREALLKKSAHFADRGHFFLSRYLNIDKKGIVLAAYNESFRHKRQMYLSIMKQFGFGQRVMETRIIGEVTELIKQARLTGGKPFDPNDMLHMCVVNVISSILLGRRYKYDDPMLTELMQVIHESISTSVPEVELFPVLRFIPPFRKRMETSIIAFHRLMGFLGKEIDDVIKRTNDEAEQDDNNDSFVRQFIKSTPPGEVYDREELLQTARDLFQAGDDTSSTTLRWIIFHLANYPNVQSRLQKEVDRVVGCNRLPSLSDEVNMPFTQAFILETMRRRTLVPLSIFRRTMCDTQVGDCFIPVDTTVIANLYSAHMDPKEWEEPHSFRPERFLDKDGQVTGKERIIPFSLGKRSCLGESLAKQELFLFTSGIAQNFEVRPPEGQTEVTCHEETTFVTEPAMFQVRMIERTR